MMKFAGRRLRAARLVANVSSEAAAAHAGVSAYTLTAYERGRHVPNADRLAKLAEITGVAITDFYDVEVEVA